MNRKWTLFGITVYLIAVVETLFNQPFDITDFFAASVLYWSVWYLLGYTLEIEPNSKMRYFIVKVETLDSDQNKVDYFIKIEDPVFPSIDKIYKMLDDALDASLIDKRIVMPIQEVEKEQYEHFQMLENQRLSTMKSPPKKSDTPIETLGDLRELLNNLSQVDLNQPIKYNSPDYSLSGANMKAKFLEEDLYYTHDDDPVTLKTKAELLEYYEEEEIDRFDKVIKKGELVLEF